MKIIIIIGVMSSSQLLFGAQISVFSPTALPSIANKLPHELLPKKQKERTKCKSIKIISQKEKKKIKENHKTFIVIIVLIIVVA